MEYKSLHFSKSQTSILKHLYTILTDDNEILLILFNQIYCGKNNIKNVELSYDQKHLTLLIGDVDETSKNIIEKKYRKRDERIVDGTTEKSLVTLNVFKNSIIMNRRTNL